MDKDTRLLKAQRKRVREAIHHAIVQGLSSRELHAMVSRAEKDVRGKTLSRSWPL